MIPLDHQCVKTMTYGYRPGTQCNYKSCANGYHRFCYFYELQPFPATEWNLVRYVRYLANGVTSYGTVTGYLSTIKRLHEIGGYPFPQELHQLKLELMTIKFELAGPMKQVTPVTLSLLVRIFEVVNQADNKQMVGYAALVIGFCLFLRKSNLVPESLSQFKAGEQLVKGDVWNYLGYMMVDIRWSKTLQYRESVVITIEVSPE